jgi:hypothetical protein
MQTMRAIVFCLLISAMGSAVARAEMRIDRLDGPVTAAELSAFKEHLRTIPMPASNKGNNMVYGTAGGAAEALGDVYQITQDRELLDLLIRFADHMLHRRNDPKAGKVIWTGNREMCWPNSPPEAKEPLYSGTENGDVIAHICYAAELILRDKSLWSQQVGVGDEFGYGATYLQRARTYIRECDRTIDTFLLPWWIERGTNRQRVPDHDLFGALGERQQRDRGKPVPWNQQAMFNGGYQRLAVCHEILGDDPDRVRRYDAIVQASIDWLLSDVVKYEVNGHPCYKWSYAEEGKRLRYVEDSGHAGYDLMMVHRAWTSGRYGLTREQVQPFANTIMHVLNKGDGKFAWKVDGTGNTRDYLPGTFIYFAEFSPQIYAVVGKAMLERARTRPETAGRLLWVKHWRNIGKFPSQADGRR